MSNANGGIDHDDITEKTWKYRLQRVIGIRGDEYVRQISTDGSGTISFENWHKLAFTTDTVDAANAIVDYNKADKQIKIGWNGDSLTTSNLKYLAGYDLDGNIKDVAWDAAMSKLGISTGSWTPTLSGMSSYSYQRGRYVKIGDVAIVSFSIWGIMAGSNTEQITISGCPLIPADGGYAGGGNLSGYYTTDEVSFSGWSTSTDGKFYAIGQTIRTGDKWESSDICQKTSGECGGGGTLMFRTNS